MGKRVVRTDATLEEEVKDFVMRALPTHRKIGQYIRQSRDMQVKRNKQSTAMQDEDMRKKLLCMGWHDELIVKFDQDQGKSGQWRIDQRVGMNEMYGMIESGEIGAVACFDPSRLFRDLTRVQYMAFVNLAADKQIPIVTYYKIYWPANRQDAKALIEKFEAAAAFTDEVIHGKLLPAKRRAVREDLSYAGHAVPMGYIIESNGERKFYAIYEPHARLIRYLFRRYRELDGSLGKLGRELREQGFRFPHFQGVENIPHVALKWTKDGYPIGRQGLISILTNPSYIGWYVYDGVIVSQEAHQPIIDRETFDYAYNRLSKTTLDGEPNENKSTVNTRQGEDIQALLERLVHNDENPVYVMTRKKTYTAKINNDGWKAVELVVDVNTLDAVYTDILLKVLVVRREQGGLEDAWYGVLKRLQLEKKQEVVSLDAQIENARKAIARAGQNKRIAEEERYEEGVREAIHDLKRLKPLLSTLLDRAEQADSEGAELEECENLLDGVFNDWNRLHFDRKQRFVRLVTKGVNMVEVSPHFIRLEIVWKEPLSCSIVGYMRRARGRQQAWSQEEDGILQAMYPTEDRANILKALPDRSWEGIVQHALIIGVKRRTFANSSGFHEALTWSDACLINDLGIGDKRVHWCAPI